MTIYITFILIFSLWSFSSAQVVDSSGSQTSQKPPLSSYSKVVPESTAFSTPSESPQPESTTTVIEQPSQPVDSESTTKIWYAEYVARGLVTLFVGVLSFFLSQAYFRYRDKKKKQKDFFSLLSITAEEVKRNLDSECQIHAYLFVNIMPTFELSFFVPDNIFKELTNVCENYTILKNLYQKYFEYRHIQNRIDRTKKLWDTMTSQPSPPQHIQKKYTQERDDTAKLIRENIIASLDMYNMIVKELDQSHEHNLKQLPTEYLDKKYNDLQKVPEVVNAANQQNINIQARQTYH